MLTKQQIFCLESPYEMEETIGFNHKIKLNNLKKKYRNRTLHKMLRLFDYGGIEVTKTWFLSTILKKTSTHPKKIVKVLRLVSVIVYGLYIITSFIRFLKFETFFFYSKNLNSENLL